MTGEEAGASGEDNKPPTTNGVPQQQQQSQLPSRKISANAVPTQLADSTMSAAPMDSDPSQSQNANIPPSISGKRAVFFAKPETESGVAAEKEAQKVLREIADEKDGSKSENDSENETDDIIEEDKSGRWSKRRDKVKQILLTGIDGSFLAMDNETGNEVVWNEVQFSERKNFKNQEEKIRTVFDNLMQLNHVNLVRFHDWWADTKPEKPRIIFITEYMSSGSMSKFLQRAKTSETLSNIRMWKKWVIQILSALNYLHSCDPPIAHANLSCNTIFIQQNGLIKIGCCSPNEIHSNVKTLKENIRNLHYVAPEYEYLNEVTTQADIYSFGICALEMATRGNITSNGTSEVSSNITQDVLVKAVESLENPLQRDFILKCIDPDPKNRPTAKELLFHPVLFEVHSLKLLAAHVIVNSKMADHLSEDDLRIRDTSQVAFEFRGHNYTYTDMEQFHSCKMDLDKFLEDVKNGIYPLIAFAPLAHRPIKFTSISPKIGDEQTLQTSASVPYNIAASNTASQVVGRKNSADDILTSDVIESNGTSKNELEVGGGGGSTSKASSSDSHPQTLQTISPNLPPYIDTSSATSTITSMTDSLGSPTALEPSSTVSSQGGASSNGGDKPVGETRLIKHMRAAVKDQVLNVLLQLDDFMNRQLTTEVSENDQAEELVAELVSHGFICQEDSEKVCYLLTKVLEDYREEVARGTENPVEQVVDVQQQQEQQQQQQQQEEEEESNESSSNRPEVLPQQVSNSSTETMVQSPKAPKATPEDLDETSPPITMTAHPHQQQQQ